MKKLTKNSEEDNLKNYDVWAFWILIGGIILTLLSPWLFTRPWGWLELTKTGAIGDSIGGITAPIIGLTSAGLIYLSFRAQIKMNIRQWEEIKKRDDFESRNKNEQYALNLAKILKENTDKIDNIVTSIFNINIYNEQNRIYPNLFELTKLCSPIIKIYNLFCNEKIDRETLFLIDVDLGGWSNKIKSKIISVTERIDLIINENIIFEDTTNKEDPTNEEVLEMYSIELKKLIEVLSKFNLNVSIGN